jgi:hypothetical protein
LEEASTRPEEGGCWWNASTGFDSVGKSISFVQIRDHGDLLHWGGQQHFFSEESINSDSNHVNPGEALFPFLGRFLRFVFGRANTPVKLVDFDHPSEKRRSLPAPGVLCPHWELDSSTPLQLHRQALIAPDALKGSYPSFIQVPC